MIQCKISVAQYRVYEMNVSGSSCQNYASLPVSDITAFELTGFWMYTFKHWHMQSGIRKFCTHSHGKYCNRSQDILMLPHQNKPWKRRYSFLGRESEPEKTCRKFLMFTFSSDWVFNTGFSFVKWISFVSHSQRCPRKYSHKNTMPHAAVLSPLPLFSGCGQ